MTFPLRRRLLDAVCALTLGGLATGVVAAPADTPKNEAAPAASSNAALELDQTILNEIKKNSQIMKNLRHLSDVIGPRLTGSPALEKANNWTAEVMKSYGLENVKLEPWEIPMGWTRGTVHMKLVEPREMTLLACSAGWSPGTNGRVTGPVVVLDNARTKADLEKYKGKLKNAIILRSPPSFIAPVTDNRTRYNAAPAEPKKEEPKKESTSPDSKPVIKEQLINTLLDEQPPATAGGQPPAGGAQPPRGGGGGFGDRAAINDFLKEEGAAAVLSDSAKPHGLLVTTGSWRGNDREVPKNGLASLFITHEHYALLYRLAKDSKEPPKVEIEVTNKFTPGPITCYNTCGDVKGSEKPDEIVVVGAHLDSWELGTGTTDNGTGSSVTLEVARTIAAMAKAGKGPKRTIRFILFSGEEQGLHGSRQYCIRHKEELDKHSLALVHDTGTGKVLSLGVLGRENCKKILEPELVSLKSVGFEGLTSGGLRGGTDHWSFHQAGVPGFACSQDPDEYRYTHHTQSDTFDKAKEPNLIQGAQVLAVTAMRVANLPSLLPRQTAEAGPRGDRPGRP